MESLSIGVGKIFRVVKPVVRGCPQGNASAHQKSPSGMGWARSLPVAKVCSSSSRHSMNHGKHETLDEFDYVGQLTNGLFSVLFDFGHDEHEQAVFFGRLKLFWPLLSHWVVTEYELVAIHFQDAQGFPFRNGTGFNL